MTVCPCVCHNGPHYPCSIPGGCYEYHLNERRPDLREAAIALGGAPREGTTGTPSPQPACVAPVAVTTPEPRQERPAGACVTHLPPRPGYHWRRADDGYQTCSSCYDRIHRLLSPLAVDDDGRPDSVPGLFVLLNPRPGVGGHGRRAPGFGPRSPANDHIVAMMDTRSTRLDEHDPHSVPGVLAAWCREIFEERHLIPPVRTVPAMAKFLDNHLDWLTRHEWVEEFHAELRELHNQMRAIGQQRRKIGDCPNTIDEGTQTRQCGSKLFAPLYGDQITCFACGRQWARDEWLRLGDLLDAG